MKKSFILLFAAAIMFACGQNEKIDEQLNDFEQTVNNTKNGEDNNQSNTQNTGAEDNNGPSGYIVDYAPIELTFLVIDKDSNILMTKDSINGVPFNKIIATYENGNRETLHVYDYQQTRAIMAYWTGFVYTEIPETKIMDNGKVLYTYPEIKKITIGQYDALEAWDNVSVSIDWGDGMKDIIAFTNKIVGTDEKGAIQFERTFTINGKENPTGQLFYIVK